MIFFERLVDFFCRPFYRWIPRNFVIQFAKFCVIGVVGFLIDYGIFHLALDVFGFGHYYSAFFSFPFAVTATWVGNRLFTFRGQSRYRMHHEWTRFSLVCIGGFILNRGAFSLLTATIPLVYEYPILGLLGGTVAGMFFNFFAARRLVFR